jgi:hypothetical protein
MGHGLLRNEQPQDHAHVGAEKIAKIRRRAEGNIQAEEFYIQPALCDFGRRSVHDREAHAQIPHLLFEIVFEDLFEKFLMAVEQGLVDGGFGVSILEDGMMIAAGVNVAQHGDVHESAECGGDGYEPLGDKLFDDSLILREAFERFHDTLPNYGPLGREHERRGNPEHVRPSSGAAIHGILLLWNVSVNNNVFNGSIGTGFTTLRASEGDI